jgi:hypothetical protein
MDGMLTGRYKPLDFRFFIWHTNYAGGWLDKAARSGKYYQLVACSRLLVLKQCIQMPNSLWHVDAKILRIPYLVCVKGEPC